MRAPTGLDDPGRTSSPRPGDDVWPDNRRGPVGTLTIPNSRDPCGSWVWFSADRVTPLIPVIPATRVQMDCHPGCWQEVGALVASSWVARQGAPWRTGAMTAEYFLRVRPYALDISSLALRGPETMWGPRRTTRLAEDASSGRAAWFRNSCEHCTYGLRKLPGVTDLADPAPG